MNTYYKKSYIYKDIYTIFKKWNINLWECKISRQNLMWLTLKYHIANFNKINCFNITAERHFIGYFFKLVALSRIYVFWVTELISSWIILKNCKFILLFDFAESPAYLPSVQLTTHLHVVNKICRVLNIWLFMLLKLLPKSVLMMLN